MLSASCAGICSLVGTFPSIQLALFSFKPQINSLQEWLLNMIKKEAGGFSPGPIHESALLSVTQLCYPSHTWPAMLFLARKFLLHRSIFLLK
jgi:hypothetical protein